ncbi:MAG: hypothetical protein FWD58_03435 [Firmicutes bacterium]|nr:hypothetical protein [Bacillota bacterium]
MTMEINATLDDLWSMFGAALRYGLGRQSYITSLIPQVIKDNFSLLDEKWTINLLRDLNGYETDRVTWQYTDGVCDYESWMELKQQLLKLYAERGYTRPIESPHP